MTKISINHHCNNCGHDFSHEQLHSISVIEKTEVLEPVIGAHASEGHEYALFRCTKCSNVVTRRTFWHTDLAPNDYEPRHTSWFPKPHKRPIPNWIGSLEEIDAHLLRETYSAFNSDLPSLSIMGIRALFDQLLVRKVGDIGGFQVKIEKCVRQQLLTQAQADGLKIVIDLGSASAHRGHSPDDSSIVTCLDLLESHLEPTHTALATVRDKTPKREKIK